jgi:AraC-like DNA-binding protein
MPSIYLLASDCDWKNRTSSGRAVDASSLCDHSGGVTETPIPARLARFVRRIGVVPALVSAAEMYRRLPDGEVELLVRVSQAGATATVIGPRTRALVKPGPRATHTVLLRFRIGGAYPFFARPVSELANGVVPLELVWGRRAQEMLAECVNAGATRQATLAALTHILDSNLLYEPDAAVRIRRLLSTIAASPRLPTVAQLAAEAGVGERQLQRVFNQVIGLAPKRFLQIVRFRRALACARTSPRADWAAIAGQAGYFDQAHLIAEFRALSGTTPRVLVSRGEGERSRHR